MMSFPAFSRLCSASMLCLLAGCLETGSGDTGGSTGTFETDSDFGTGTGGTGSPTTDPTANPTTDPTDPTSPTTDPTDPTTDPTDPTTDTSGDTCGAGGRIEHAFAVAQDDCSHHPYGGFLDTMGVLVILDGEIATLEIVGGPTLEPVSGPIGDDCSVALQGSGTFAGYSGISVSWDGSLSDAGFTGTLTIGQDGQLPGGCPIAYDVTPAN